MEFSRKIIAFLIIIGVHIPLLPMYHSNNDIDDNEKQSDLYYQALIQPAEKTLRNKVASIIKKTKNFDFSSLDNNEQQYLLDVYAHNKKAFCNASYNNDTYKKFFMELTIYEAKQKNKRTFFSKFKKYLCCFQ